MDDSRKRTGGLSTGEWWRSQVGVHLLGQSPSFTGLPGRGKVCRDRAGQGRARGGRVRNGERPSGQDSGGLQSDQLRKAQTGQDTAGTVESRTVVVVHWCSSTAVRCAATGAESQECGLCSATMQCVSRQPFTLVTPVWCIVPVGPAWSSPGKRAAGTVHTRLRSARARIVCPVDVSYTRYSTHFPSRSGVTSSRVKSVTIARMAQSTQTLFKASDD